MDRATVLKMLPGEEHCNARWLYRCLDDLYGETGEYRGTAGELRELAGYGPGPDCAPKTQVMLAVLERAGLIRYEYERQKAEKRVLHVRLCSAS